VPQRIGGENLSGGLINLLLEDFPLSVAKREKNNRAIIGCPRRRHIGVLVEGKTSVVSQRSGRGIQVSDPHLWLQSIFDEGKSRISLALVR